MNHFSSKEQPEFWLGGSIAHISPILQPAAHALLQSEKELKEYTADFPKELLWAKPNGCASVGFHMNHMTGVLDRMLSYAQSKPLTEAQFAFLKKEGTFNVLTAVADLQINFSNKVAEALTYFKTIDETQLTEKRTVGREQLPSTLLGVIFHAAEHSQRHVGQLWVTVHVLKANL